MSANADTLNAAHDGHADKHPTGLYVLFGTEMWERFSFYSMLALFTLYLRDPNEGFGWTAAEATWLYSTYLMFVYLSPLVGGFIADRYTGYRKAVMIGGFFFMAGHATLSIPAIWAVYLALTFLVIGNGFFKPNVSTMVGNLYPEGSHLKDRAYNIFYMGINVGAALAPIVMEIVKAYYGFHVAFAVAAFGMVISVAILWYFKNLVMQADNKHAGNFGEVKADDQAADTAATATDAPPHETSHQKASNLMNTVPGAKAHPGVDCHIRDRDRVLDGVSPKRFHYHLFRRRQHRVERLGNDFELDQRDLDPYPNIPPRSFLGFPRPPR